ncbi:MAG TPA: hypothetical protein HPP94_08805 [Desulfuromonadales bacterium]|nr:hypothetical protein [Desulfuromonadales bacterium]
MANAVTKIPVLSEEEAWSLLEKAVSNGLPKGTIQLNIGDWYNRHIKFEGERYNSTITPDLMQVFIDLQKTIYRTYSKLTYNETNHRLSDDEKKSLEIFVKVEPGSSDFTAMLNKAVETLTKGAVNEMQAHHYVIIIVASILCLTGTVMWRAFLKHRSEIKQADLDLALSQEESHRLEILGNAIKREPYVGIVQKDSEEFHNAVIKCGKTTDRFIVADQYVNGEQAGIMARNSRSQSEEVTLNGEYRITKVDSKDPDVFKVYLVGNGLKEFSATLDRQTIISGKNLAIIQAAEWGQKPIRLMIDGKTVRGEVTSARIVDVPDRFASGT